MIALNENGNRVSPRNFYSSEQVRCVCVVANFLSTLTTHSLTHSLIHSTPSLPSSTTMTSFTFLLAAIALPLFYIILHFTYQKEYPVHLNGIVLVSGASSGIGRHAAERLAQEGYKVYCGVRKQTDKNEIILMKNSNLIPIIFDVTVHETSVDAVAIIEKDMQQSGLPFVALVNNAGISRRMVAEFHDMEDIYRVFDTNVFGMMHLTQLCLPLLRQSKGRIVMISSVNGKIGKPYVFCFIMFYFH